VPRADARGSDPLGTMSTSVNSLSRPMTSGSVCGGSAHSPQPQPVGSRKRKAYRPRNSGDGYCASPRDPPPRDPPSPATCKRSCAEPADRAPSTLCSHPLHFLAPLPEDNPLIPLKAVPETPQHSRSSAGSMRRECMADRTARGPLPGEPASSLAVTRGRRKVKQRYSFDADEFDMSVDADADGDQISEESSETRGHLHRANRATGSVARGALSHAPAVQSCCTCLLYCSVGVDVCSAFECAAVLLHVGCITRHVLL
jgi:hypothetical protein